MNDLGDALKDSIENEEVSTVRPDVDALQEVMDAIFSVFPNLPPDRKEQLLAAIADTGVTFGNSAKIINFDDQPLRLQCIELSIKAAGVGGRIDDEALISRAEKFENHVRRLSSAD